MTIQEIMTGRNFEHKYLTNKDNTPLRCRRNGKTKTWKTNDNFMIPVKRGLYEYGYIANFASDKTLNNADDWYCVS